MKVKSHREMFCLVMLSCVLVTAANAQTLDERFEAANRAYQDKNYSTALQLYGELRDRFSVDDPAVHYNIGNTYYQLEQWGRAVLSYKRALATVPAESMEKKIRNNLTMTVEALLERHRKDVSKSVTVLDETHGVVYSLFHLVSANTLAWLFLPTWVLFFIALLVRSFGAAKVRQVAKTAAIVLAIPSIITGGLLLGNMSTQSSVVRGVIIERSARIREGRSKDSPVTDVPEGLEVRILDASDPQETEVQLSNGKQGWLPSSAVERI